MRVSKSFLLASFLYAGMLSAQPPQPTKFLPVITASSPEAAAFSRYGNYQVNLFTGIPDISIPLYNITVGELTVPISINYHASGIKVSEIPSRVGLGWSLHAGGSITRKVMGKADELLGNYFSATPTSSYRVKLTTEINAFTEAGLDYLWQVDNGNYDVEPDIFSYSFPGQSGKFLFNQKDNFKPVLIPYAPIEISKTLPPNPLTFAITDESGIKYNFGSTEMTTTSGLVTTNCTSAWLLSEMISANKQDSIYFRYIMPGVCGESTISDYLVLNDNCTGIYQQGSPQCNQVGQFFSSTTTSSTDSKQLTQIDFKNGKIVFEAAPELRQDFFGHQKRLSAIKIYNFDPLYKSYSLIRSITFFHSYFSPGNRLRLDSIQFRTGNGTAVETYRFTYNLSIALPSVLSRMKDYWGYFNNVNNVDPFGNPTSIKKMQVPYTVHGNPPVNTWVGGDKTYARDPDPNYMQACILQRITFPTGGYTQFEYETNQYLDGSTPTYAGGLRVKSIKSYTSSTATPVVKTYKYGLNETGYGRANFLMEDHFFMSVQNVRAGRGTDPFGVCLVEPNTKTTRTYFANPTNDLESFDGSPVVYPYVTEYIGDGTTNAGKTSYTFSDKPDGKTTLIGYGKPMLTSYHFVRGLITNRSDYRKNSDGSYAIVAETRKKYQQFPFTSTTGGIGLVVFKSLVTESGVGLNFCSNGLCDCAWTDSYSYLFNNYEISLADNKLITDTTITYDQNDPTKFASVIKSYTYDDITHLQLKRLQVINSKGETIRTGYTYPYNHATAPYTTMSNTTYHIWDKVVTDTVTNSVSGQLTLKKNNYQSFTGNNFLPANIELKIKANTIETRASFNQYDLNGNILEMQKTNDLKQSYIWDYNGMQPIAEVINAAQSDIAYTSFEADGKGNWTFTGPPGLDPTAPTGKRCYTLGTNITKSGLSTSTTYIVSYWKKSGTVGVNSTTSVTGRSVNGWTYYEHKVVNPSGGLVTVSGTSGIIDELRLYPATNVQMTTYTYTPLIGVTSQCDANNRITYYEYDRFNRLMLIRDQDKNILKQFCYNYAGQPENCGIAYNQQQSGMYNKSNCSGCQAGSAVTYIVPANTYSAPTVNEANQLASDDVAANGQAYADANGTCGTPANANVSGSNAINQTHTFRFTKICNPSSFYDFSMGPNAPLSTLGPVQTGTYNVTFNPPAGSGQYTYRIGSLTLHANSGTIYNVTVGTGGVIVNITP